ncbi:hypothetical protein MRX96_027166 [Rhipicephalus microplus]
MLSVPDRFSSFALIYGRVSRHVQLRGQLTLRRPDVREGAAAVLPEQGAHKQNPRRPSVSAFPVSFLFHDIGPSAESLSLAVKKR